jgi:fermentation-respiration switch protein FrsA (DUF1100 family)
MNDDGRHWHVLPLLFVLFATTLLAPACASSTPSSSASSTTASASATLATSSTQPTATPSTAAPNVSLPDSPAGLQARWLIEATARLPIPEAEVRDHFDAAFLAQVNPETLNQGLQGAGSLSVVSIETNEPNALVIIVSTGGTQVQVSLSVDEKGLISGLRISPAAPPPTYAPYQPPSYVNLDAFTEQSVSVGEGTQWALPGTLTLPKGNGPFPIVVLVQGSGPSDRDETIGPNKPFRDLAWGLASLGIAVLRFDKRTYVYPTKVDAATITVWEESIDDALTAVKLVRELPEIDSRRIYVLGHSLGAMVAPRIGQQDPALAGLVMMAGATRPLEDVLLDQVTYLDSLNGGPTAGQMAQLEQLEAAVATVKDPNLSPSTPASLLPLNIPAAYWLDLRGYKPADVVASLDMDLLVLQGARDYQVTTADFAGWQSTLSGRPNARLILYPDLNHEFVTGTGKATPAEYEHPGHVAEKVVSDIAGWIKS